jgi:hypothetical protein
MPSGELETLPATVAGFLSRLPVPSHDAHEIYSPEPGLGSGRPSRPTWKRTKRT